MTQPYSLGEDYEQSEQSRGSAIFQPGVDVQRLSVQQGQVVVFQIMPALDPAAQSFDAGTGKYTCSDMTSWVPFRDPETGRIASFGRLFWYASFIGHPGAMNPKVDIVGRKTWDSSRNCVCPLQRLYSEARKQDKWKYLTDRVMYEGNKFETSILRSPRESLMCDLIIFDQATQRYLPVLGVFGKSATDALMAKNTGLLQQMNPQATPEIVASNPLAKWLAGDITDPRQSVFLQLTNKQGSPGHAISIMQPVTRQPIAVENLVKRHNWNNLEDVLVNQSEQDIVDLLCEALNKFKPGTQDHEHEFLKYVFGDHYKVPDPPAYGSVPGTGPGQMQGQTGFVAPPAAAVPTQQIPPVPTPTPQVLPQQVPPVPAPPPQVLPGQQPVPQGLPQTLPPAPVQPVLPQTLPPPPAPSPIPGPVDQNPAAGLQAPPPPPPAPAPVAPPPPAAAPPVAPAAAEPPLMTPPAPPAGLPPQVPGGATDGNARAEFLDQLNKNAGKAAE